MTISNKRSVPTLSDRFLLGFCAKRVDECLAHDTLFNLMSGNSRALDDDFFIGDGDDLRAVNNI